jgi:hypothetical protein
MKIEIYETVEALNGKSVTRIKSSLFYWGAVLSLFIGFYFIAQKITLGGSLILFLAPCLLLYPLVRFLFGGKDSAVAVVTTAVVEEVLKAELKNMSNKKKRKS